MKQLTDNTKRILIIVISVVLTLAVAAGLTAGLIIESLILNDTSFNEEQNLLKGAKYSCGGNTARSSNLGGSVAQEMTVTLKSASKINTLVFYEPTESVTDFEIFVDNELIYKQQEMGRLRYATFPAVETSSFVVRVNSALSDYDVDKIEGFYIERPKNDFRVVSYITVDSMFERTIVTDPVSGAETKIYGDVKPSFEWESFQTVTDVIMFSYATFDENGELFVQTEVADRAHQMFKDIGVRVFINFLVKKDGVNSVPQLYSRAMGANRDKLVNNLVAFVADRGFDGIDFDYEYPDTDDDWKIYNGFLVEMSKRLPESIKLSAATSLFDIRYSNAAWRALDYVNVMTYDGLDKFGNHSSFSQCAVNALTMYNQEIALDRSKINLGLPFYSRPTIVEDSGKLDLASVWVDYRSEIARAIALGQPLTRWDNYNALTPNVLYDSETKLAIPDGTIRSFNGCQMIQDKTALAYDYGAGGLMVWHHTCDLPYDNELSLFRAINEILK